MNQQQIEEIKARASCAHAELQKLCDGGKFTMCVPVQPTDTDIVISHSLNDIEALFVEVTRLRAVLQQIAATTYTPRFDAVTAYGIGYQHAIKAMTDIARKALEDHHGSA